LLGVGIGVYATNNTEFIGLLPLNGDEPNFNLAVPVFMLEQLPVGAVGLALVALFAAAMSSLDSVINSLSASTMDDFVRRFRGNKDWDDATELTYSRLLTVFWGAATLIMSFFVADIATTILVAINKVGSLINGPVLAVFALGICSTRTTGTGACAGLLLGFILNLSLWQFAPSISWLWWNVFGFIATCVSAWLVSHLAVNILSEPGPSLRAEANGNSGVVKLSIEWALAALLLMAWFGVLMALLLQF
jgi:SSS family solute:Na+ symporter